jgi:hypothetical protein
MEICNVDPIDQIMTNELGGTMELTWETRGVYKVWWGKFKGMRPLGKPRSKWKDNIKVDFKEFVNTGLICFRIRTIGGVL